MDSDEELSQQTNEQDQITELTVETDELIERLRKNLTKPIGIIDNNNTNFIH